MSAKEVLTSNEETFSFSTFHGIEIMIREKDGTINYNRFFNSIKGSCYKGTYKFKDFIKNNSGLFVLIQSYIDSESVHKISPLTTEEFCKSYLALAVKDKKCCDDLSVANDHVLQQKTSENEHDKLDVLKLKHNITTLNQLGIFNSVDSKYRNEVRGQYGRTEFITFVACAVNPYFYQYTNQIMILLNERMIKENEDQKELIERLTQERDEAIINDVNSNKGQDHHRPGSISIIPLKQENRYRLRYFQTTIDPNDYPRCTIINNVYNAMRMKQLIYFYVRSTHITHSKFIRGSEYEIANISEFVSFINDLQEHKFQVNVSVDDVIKTYTDTHTCKSQRFIGDMFELFAWKKFGYPIYKYTTTENYSLTKQDYGIDLFAPDITLLGQCKCYRKTPLTMKSMEGFRNFCKEFSQWERVLIVNKSIEMDKEVKYSKLWTIKYIDDNEFREFLAPYIDEEELDKEVPKRVVDLSKIRYKIDKKQINDIRSFVSESISSPVLLTNMITNINQKFKLNKPITEAMFYHICADLYQVDRHGTILRNKNNEKILVKAKEKKEITKEIYIDDDVREFVDKNITSDGLLCTEAYDLYTKSTTDPCKATDFNKQMKQLCTKKRVYPSRQWRWLRNSSSK